MADKFIPPGVSWAIVTAFTREDAEAGFGSANAERTSESPGDAKQGQTGSSDTSQNAEDSA